LDGTLVDSLDGIAGSLNRALAGQGMAAQPRAAVRGFIGNGSRTLIERAARAGADAAAIDAVEAAFKADYEATWREGTVAYEGFSGLLETLAGRGHPLAVLSNKTHAFAVEMVRYIFSGIEFAAVAGQRDGIPHKPDPRGALEVAAEIGRAPEQCILTGDSTIDLETARRAGMRAVAVAWGYHDRGRLIEAGAETVVDDVAGLEGALVE
jgi:phosphoglycolate phosphatase